MADRSAASVLDGLRNPEYTGENRCIPCTIANALIAVSVAILASFVATELAVAVLVVSALAIYFRGYLIPGTPEITERYLPEPVLRFFNPHPIEDRGATEFVDGSDDDGTGSEESDEDAFAEEVEAIMQRHERTVDPEEFLEDLGVVEPDGDGHRLTDAFGEEVHERIVAYRDAEIDPATIAAMFDADPDGIEELDRAYPAYEVGIRVRKWPSRGALIADAAAHETLAAWTDRWTGEVSVEQRADIVEWLRGLYDGCPVCDGEVRFSDDVIESCCGQFRVTTVACTACGERLREFDPSKVGTREDLKGITP